MNLDNRCGHPVDEDAFQVLKIEMQFAIPTWITIEDQRKLNDLFNAIVKSPSNQLWEGVHWLSGVGAKPHYSRVDAALLGIPFEPEGAPADGEEPTFDTMVLHFESRARAFVNAEEMQRVTEERVRQGIVP